MSVFIDGIDGMLVYYLLLRFSGNKVVFNTFGRYCIRVPISQRLIVMYGIGYMMQNQVNKSIKMIAPVAATAFVAVMLAGAFSLPAAFAAVTFDPATGTGFVGKGEVQTAFGWNNAQLQQRASSVSFSVESEAKYDVLCEWTTGEGTRGEQHHEVTVKKTTTVNSEVATDPRANPQNKVTGFNLLGYGTTTTSGSVPVVGEDCLGVGTDAKITNVEKISETGTLYVSYSGTKVALATF